MKTKDEILLFLVRNSMPEYYKYPVYKDTYAPGCELKTKADRRDALALRVAGNMRFTCETSKIEKFLGEKLNFEKHLRSLHEEKVLHFNGIPESGDYYDSPNYRKLFAESNGQVLDYKTNKSYVAFYYRENNFLDDCDRILEDMLKLGL